MLCSLELVRLFCVEMILLLKLKVILVLVEILRSRRVMGHWVLRRVMMRLGAMGQVHRMRLPVGHHRGLLCRDTSVVNLMMRSWDPLLEYLLSNSRLSRISRVTSVIDLRSLIKLLLRRNRR